MKNKLIYPLVVVMVAACGGDGDQTARHGQVGEYETVQEGSASGVTSTIQGPGENVPPITGTNADTTTAFALNPAAMPPAAMPQQQPGTLAGTMSAPVPYPSTPMAVARPGLPRQPAPQPMTSATPVPRPAPERTTEPRDPAPPPTETTEPQPVPEPTPAEPSTETTATPPSTDTAATPPAQKPPPQPDAEPKQDEEQEEEEEEPPPPPPPPGV